MTLIVIHHLRLYMVDLHDCGGHSILMEFDDDNVLLHFELLHPHQAFALVL